MCKIAIETQLARDWTADTFVWKEYVEKDMDGSSNNRSEEVQPIRGLGSG